MTNEETAPPGHGEQIANPDLAPTIKLLELFDDAPPGVQTAIAKPKSHFQTPEVVGAAFDAMDIARCIEETQPNDDQLPKPMNEVNITLALGGLRWIREQWRGSSTAEKPSSIRRQALGTLRLLESIQEEGHKKIAQILDRTLSSKEKTVSNAENKEQGLENLLAIFERVAESEESIAKSPLREELSRLFRRLRVNHKPDGTFDVETSGNYASMIQDLAARIIQDPTLNIHLADLQEGVDQMALPDKEGKVLTAGWNKIGFDVNDAVLWKHVDITPELAERWLGLADRLLPDTIIADLVELGPNGPQHKLASTVLLGESLILNNLERVATTKFTMEDIVNVVHAVASQGLKPYRDGRQQLGLSIIGTFLRNNALANFAIISAPQSTQPLDIRLSAYDILCTLDHLNFEFVDPNFCQFTNDQKRWFYRYRAAKEHEEQVLYETNAALNTHLSTSTGRSNIVYARYSSKPRSPSIAIRVGLTEAQKRAIKRT